MQLLQERNTKWGINLKVERAWRQAKGRVNGDFIMDRIVRDEFGEEGYCILDKLVRFESGNKTNFMIDIATRGKPKDISNYLCKAISPNSPSPFDEGKAAAQNCASSSTLAHFYLGKFP